MAAADGGRLASVPLQPLPRPTTLVSGGTRLDGRGLEEFRNICERAAPFTSANELRPVGAGRSCCALSAAHEQCGPQPCNDAASARPLQPTPPPPPPPPAVLSTKVISRAAGSAYAEFGGTKVMAAV